MPLLRKIFKIGSSEAVTIPKSWLDYIERETGKRPSEVLMEVNGSITITPKTVKAKESSEEAKTF